MYHNSEQFSDEEDFFSTRSRFHLFQQMSSQIIPRKYKSPFMLRTTLLSDLSWDMSIGRSMLSALRQPPADLLELLIHTLKKSFFFFACTTSSSIAEEVNGSGSY